MGTAKSFEDLDVWKKEHQFVLDVYRITESFPKHELFGLTSQLRRAAVSIPANIAEGFRRSSKPVKVRFYVSRWDRLKNVDTICALRLILYMRKQVLYVPAWKRSAKC